MTAILKTNSLIKKSRKDLIITIPKLFRDELWANEFGKTQNKIRKYVDVQKEMNVDRVIFNFVNCRWADPLPMMSTLFEIINIRRHQVSVLIRLPKADRGQVKNPNKPYHKSPNRFLYFLASEGFLECIEELNDKGIVFFNKPVNGFGEYKELNVQASYVNATCIPIKILFVPTYETKNESFAQETVEKLLEGIDANLYSKLSTNSRVRLIYKLRVALQEFIHNTQEHAYKNGSSQNLFSIYVRYRAGGVGLDTTGKKILNTCIKEEKDNCPMLKNAWLENRSGCLEVFVLDHGIGIVNSFKDAGMELQWKYKLSQVMYESFAKGTSTKKERNTAFGGLHLLHNLLVDTGDYIRALDSGVWFGSTVPVDRPTKSTHKPTNTSVNTNGMAIHLQLGWKEVTDLGDKWANFDDTENIILRDEYNLDEEECRPSFEWFERQTIIDERFDEVEKKKGQGEWVLWFVHPHRMKWDIISHLQNTIIPFVKDRGKLIIADIPSYEAETYAAAIGRFKTKEDWPIKISDIVLVTDRFRFAFSSNKNKPGEYGFSKLYENFSNLSFKIEIIPKPKNFRVAIVRWIKWHDSKRIWAEIDQDPLSFINEKVTWSKNKEISGYLDFSKSTHNPRCLFLYQKSLARIIGVFHPIKLELHPLDRLTRPILRETEQNFSYGYSHNYKKIALALGSVLVSGSTLDSSSSLKYDLHFFIHKDSPIKKMKPSVFYWLPSKAVGNDPPRLERIGKTASIAPEGWKSYEVPRYDTNGICIGYRTPKETYRDWQSLSPIIAKTGHWSYEGHHDLLTINIVSSVDRLLQNRIGHKIFQV